PISHTQDTAGPMARTVRDAALLLTALAGADARDQATAGSAGRADQDYTRHLDARGLRGARIGVARQLFYPHDAVEPLTEEALRVLRREGATVLDPADVGTLVQWEDNELPQLLYEFKAGVNAYLARLKEAPVRSLKEVIAFNERNRKREMPYFGQDLLVKAEARGPLTSEEYRGLLERNRRLTRAEGIDAVMGKLKLDALVAPTEGPAWLTDVAAG